MGKLKVEGHCALCGQYGLLSFEHIPPKSAFNDNSEGYWILPGSEVYDLQLGESPKGKLYQGGMGKYSLCGPCNNQTGRWYGREFVDWCKVGMYVIHKAKGSPSLIYVQNRFPLRIIKQVISMFLSINKEQEFYKRYPELVRFVLKKDEKGLNPRFRVFTYYTYEGYARYKPISFLGDLTKPGEIVAMTEMAFPPYGFVLTIDSNPPDRRLYEISFFSKYDYDERADLALRFPVLPTYSPVPADYRTEQEIRRDIASSPD